jgi:RNA polymerase sigma-70 factor (ECF subfamily)
MSVDLVAQARAGDDEAFARLVEPYRRELHVHCYRILGSFAEADDALQETLLAAWQGLAGYAGRASLRTWLYRVATSRSLLLLRTARRRPLVDWPPPGLAVPEASGRNDITWLEPYPDALLEGMADAAPGPEARYEASEAISLAFLTALQLLPPRQRAVLILRDVLGLHASEVAEALDATEESVTSALKRARATLDRRARSSAEEPPAPGSARERDLVAQLAIAYQTGDLARLVDLLSEDVRLTMPPIPLEYCGKAAVAELLRVLVFQPGHTFELVAVRANGQPAFGMYLRTAPQAPPTPQGVMVFTLAGERVRGLTRFDTTVLPSFGLGPTPTPLGSAG